MELLRRGLGKRDERSCTAGSNQGIRVEKAQKAEWMRGGENGMEFEERKAIMHIWL
jgi:hypothetical protein